MHEHDVKVKAGVLTISTSKWKKYGDIKDLKALADIDDESGKLIVDLLSKEFDVTHYRLVPDDMVRISSEVKDLLRNVDAVVTTGGTGITPTDVTIEAIEPILTKKLNGFGEIFRVLSYKEVGSAAILSRAFAGVVDDKIIFCLPGSSKAVKLAVDLIRDVLKHAISHARGIE
jgi:molybdenum cofactor biosynthesis protein B